jgi:UrcA family protein
MSTSTLVTATILGVLTASVSAADTSSARETVKFADINITNPSGALALYGRIRWAARSVCSHYWFKTNADEADCVHNAIANAVAQINRPALSAVYNAKYKTPEAAGLVSQNR